MPNDIQLGVNIDHIATIRQARYREMLDSPNAEPDPIAAALAAEKGGAHGITVHLRADRRHIQEKDVFELRKRIRTKLNLEMGNTPAILEVALKVGPDDVCLVPENRREVTTEGGLDCVEHRPALSRTIKKLKARGICVSLFVDPEQAQIKAAAALGADFVELHTGAFANAEGAALAVELHRLVAAAELADSLGLRINAGHGINYENIRYIVQIPHLVELNIGHAIVSRAVFFGLEEATREMLRRIRNGG